MEIAKTARQQDEAAQAAETATADMPSEDTNKQPVQINLDNDGRDADLAAATNTADLTMHSASEPISDTSSEADQANAGASDAHHWTRFHHIRRHRLPVVRCLQ